jgi:hypothetical protein
MSTRGFVGFVIDGAEKIAYNHSDSYPSGLGVHMLDWLTEAMEEPAKLREQAVALRVVDPQSEPTAEDIERLRHFGNPHVGGPVNNTEIRSWYQLLRETQGQPGLMLEAGVIEDSNGFPSDSLFCEWGYLLDLDAMTLEVYEGFQKVEHNRGRFADRAPDPDSDGYWPVALVCSFPLTGDLPDKNAMLALERKAEEE